MGGSKVKCLDVIPFLVEGFDGPERFVGDSPNSGDLGTPELSHSGKPVHCRNRGSMPENPLACSFPAINPRYATQPIFQNNSRKLAIYLTSIIPCSIPKREIANPNSANVSTIVKSPLDCRATDMLRYITFVHFIRSGRCNAVDMKECEVFHIRLKFSL
jgi:hypothetical protein